MSASIRFPIRHLHTTVIQKTTPNIISRFLLAPLVIVSLIAVALTLLLSTPAQPAEGQTLSSDGSLASITVDGVQIPGFASDLSEYYHSVPSTTNQVTIAVLANHAAATVSITVPDDADANTAGHQVNLSDGLNRTAFIVTAENGQTADRRFFIGRSVDTAWGWKSLDDFNTLAAAGNESPTSIWSDDTTMWVADHVDDKIYAYNMSTKARDSAKAFNTLAAAGNNVPTAIWSDDITMWVADSADHKIYAYKMTTKLDFTHNLEKV